MTSDSNILELSGPGVRVKKCDGNEKKSYQIQSLVRGESHQC